jgi:hypothetical protein
MTHFFACDGLLSRAARVAVCAMLLAMPGAVRAQEPARQFVQQPGAQPPAQRQMAPQPGQPQPPAPQAQPQQKPGGMEAFGKWFDDSAAGMRKGFDDMWKGMGTAGNTAGDAAKGTADVAGAMVKGTVDAAKGTADALGKFGASRVITGRARCAIAGNGAPDCKVAAVTICKAAGYKDGDSVDYETAESCPVAAYVNGRKPATGECPIEHTVTRAMCQ